ncbi:MAG TPA: FAD-dependent oxidoreductase [Bacilli bacterium]|nr:FAD-dependent oxidoreductase [Bacilli bacterium]
MKRMWGQVTLCLLLLLPLVISYADAPSAESPVFQQLVPADVSEAEQVAAPLLQPIPGANDGSTATEPVDKQQEEAKMPTSVYDVVVVGGEPEGVAAAVAAARNGARTLLVESRDGLGGLFTYGELNYLDTATFSGTGVDRGIFEEWHERVGDTQNFDREEAKAVFLEMVRDEPKLTLRLQTAFEEPQLSMDGKRLEALTLVGADGRRERVVGHRFIDCTQDADLAAAAGVPYFVGQADIGLDRRMAVTLVMTMTHADWDKIGEAMANGLYGGGYQYDTYAWGFSELKTAYQPQEADTRLRGLNLALNKDGSVSINGLQILGIDGLDPEQKRLGYQKGVREANNVLKFLRENVPGFETAQMGHLPSELYIRETRHILAEYQLSLADVWENRDQWDRVALGAYPVDIQGISYDEGDVIIGQPSLYAIPYRSLVPRKIDGLLVAGRASGYSSLAAGSARTVPTGMAAGEAAGVAAALSLEQHETFRELSHDPLAISELQQRLVNQGARLFEFELWFPYKGMWYYPSLRYLLSYGLIAAGYENNLHVEEPIGEREFLNLLELGLQRMHADDGKHAKLKANLAELKIEATDEPLTRDQMASYLLRSYGQELSEDVWYQAIEKGFIDQNLAYRLIVNRPLAKYEVFYLAARYLRKLQ